jgi:non-specific serine/threonine protein kinase/serine/threonine-protein kinase
MSFTWNRVRDLVDAVLDLPQTDRAQYLDRACSEPELRKYVDSLILSYDRAGGFLESPAPSVASLWSDRSPEDSWVGRRLGSYEILEEIGRGGMGAVYRAVRADDQYRKQVAVKLVKGGFENAFALSRFRSERQILASLEHANIARLIDGGTTDQGTPYFVMELVEGLPIDEYCDKHQLSIRKRLYLFRSVCSAVAYAHQNLIVHRDLKPGNLLVNREGVPKLLDFGIAKILAPDSASPNSEPTVAFLRVMTPEYASPEQIAGGPVSTSSDVYSLGVVLYILLTGHRPYEVDTRRPDEVADAICRSEPVRASIAAVQQPGTRRLGEKVDAVTPESVALARASRPQKLRRLLAGDLDNIVQMALRKEPERRYPSVEQLSEDIGRHLQGLPIRARRETFGYRAHKFVTRHKFSVGATVLLILSLIAGLLATLHEARIAQAQQARADRRFKDVRELANSLLFEVHDGIANLPGSTPVRKLLIERALKYLDSLSKEAKGDRSLQLELATAYDKVGDVQGQPREANLGDSAGALASYEKALLMRESLAAEDPRDPKAMRDLVNSYIRLSDLQWRMGDRSGGLSNVRKEIPTARKLADLDPTNPQNKLLLAMCHADQGYKEAMMGGDRESGVAILLQGTRMFAEMVSERPDDPSIRRRLALTYGRMAEIQRMSSQGDAESLVSFRKAIDALLPLLPLDPNNAEIRRLIAYYEHSIGELLGDMDQIPAALAQEREALASFQRLLDADPVNSQLKEDVARVRGHIGVLMVQSGNSQSAITELEQSLADLSKIEDAKNPQSYAGYAVITNQLWLGKAHIALASSAKVPAKRDDECRQAQSWFRFCQPQFDSLRDKGDLYHAVETLDDIHHELSRCRGSAK